MKSFKELQTSYNLLDAHLFQYLQVHSYCKGQTWVATQSFQASFIDTRLLQNKNNISTIYANIQSLCLPRLEDTTTKNWNNDFPMEELTKQMLENYHKLNKVLQRHGRRLSSRYSTEHIQHNSIPMRTRKTRRLLEPTKSHKII